MINPATRLEQARARANSKSRSRPPGGTTISAEHDFWRPAQRTPSLVREAIDECGVWLRSRTLG